MSNISQSLSLLLPTLSDNLPPELLSLSNSLLAQSRNRASNLKSEEEIARPYACCEIACKRLASKLQLPALHGRPPCAPRVYKKLLTFLEGALPAKLPTKPTHDDPKKSKDASSARSTPKKPAPRPAQSTPQTNQTRQAFTGKILPSHTSTTTHNDDGAPSDSMPLIRRLCHTFSTPLLAPHVYTGLCVVLQLAHRQPNPDPAEPSIRALTLSLFFLVLARMRRGKMRSESYISDCEKACAVANHACSSSGQLPVTTEEVNTWIKRVSANGWTTGQEWWSSVPEDVFGSEEEQPSARSGEGSPREEIEIRDAELMGRKRRRISARETEEEDEEDPEGVLLPGLGTMMQESVDWGSGDRRAEYVEWRVGVERRLVLMEKRGVGRTRGKGKRKSVVAAR